MKPHFENSKIRKLKISLIWPALVILAILLPIVYITLIKPANTKAAWWDQNYKYRTAYSFTATSAITTDRKVKIDVDTATLITAGKLQSDCDDIRFTGADGKLLQYFIDTNTADCNNASTDFYVKLSDIKLGGNLVYLYYGNAQAQRTDVGGRKNDFFDSSSLGTLGVGLKGYWKLDESSGTRSDSAYTSDLSANGTGGVTSTTGVLSNAAVFTSANSNYLNVADNVSLSNANSSFSVSSWVYLTNKATSQSIVSKGTANSTGGLEYLLWYRLGTDSINLTISDGANSTLFNSGLTLNAGAWYFVSAWYDGSAHTLNVQINNGTISSTSWTFGSQDTAGAFYIGADPSIANFMNGNVDNVTYYKKVLSAGERTALYNNGSGQAFAVPFTYTPSSGPTAATEEVTSGPIAYWKFDEGQGQIVNDATTHRNAGTLGATSSSASDDPTWKQESDCVSGKCLQFDGSNDYVSVSDQLSYSGGRDLSISAWIKPSDVTDVGIVMKHKDNTTKDWGLYINSSSQLTFYYEPGLAAVVTSTQTVSANRWYHVAVTYTNSTRAIKLYINGNQDGSGTGSSSSPNGDEGISIGALKSSFYSQWFFTGFIDEPKIYPYARSAAEVKADYNATAAVLGAASPKDFMRDGLVGYWPLDESTSSTCTGGSNDSCDASGRGLDGDWLGNATSSTARYGNGVTFDGTGDTISYASVPTDLVGSSTFTISFWASSTGYFLNDAAIGIIGGGNFVIYPFDTNGGNGVRVHYYGSNPFDQNSTSIPANGTFHHYVFTSRSSTDHELFVDGQSIGTSTSSLALTGASTMTIGSWTTASQFYTGKLDDVRMYNRGFSSADVQKLYGWAPGPVGYWSFDEGQGQTIKDLINGVNNGTLGTSSSVGTNDPTWVVGKYGQALTFDGSNDLVDVGAATSLNITTPFTVSAWVKRTATTSNWSGIFSSEKNATNSNGYFLAGDGNNKIAFYTLNTSNAWISITSDSAIAANQWYYVTGTWDGTTTRLYINGIQQAATGSISAIQYSFGSMTQHAFIGAYGLGGVGNDRYWPGQIDDVKIYNYARSAGQVVEDMNGGHPLGGSPVGSQFLYWKFDEKQGTAVHDSSPNKYDGTRQEVGGVSTVSWVPGKINGAVNIGGGAGNSRDCVTRSSTPFTAINNFTITFWTKPNAAQSGPKYIFYNGSSNGYGLSPGDGSGGSGTSLELAMQGVTSNAFSTHNANLSTTSWNHVVLLRDNGTWKLYVNGSLTDTTTTSPATPTGALTVGGLGTCASGLQYNGGVDEFKIYNTVLTAEQIKIDMNAGSSVAYSVLGASESAQLVDGPGAPPVGEWHVDDKDGQSFVDTSGSGNAGTLGATSSVSSDDPTWQNTGQCKYGACLKFDGTDDVARVANNAQLQFGSGSFTFATWFKSSGTAAFQTLIDVGFGGGIPMYYALLTSSGAIDIRITDATGAGLSDTTRGSGYNDGRWHYVAVVANRTTNLAKIFVDGTQAGTDISISSVVGTVNPTDPLLLGKAGGSHPLNGYLDEVKLYNYARTQSQIMYDYNRGKPVAWWKFDECQGSTLNDASGNGKHGTITIGSSGTQTAAGTCTTSGTAWGTGVSGKYGSSLNFDGTDDQVIIGANAISPLLNRAPATTTNLWFYANSTTCSTRCRLIDILTTTATDGILLALYESTGGGLGVILRSGSADARTEVTTSTVPSTGTWHMFTVVADYAAKNVKIYFNGKLVSSTSAPQFLQAAYLPATPSDNDVIVATGAQSFNGRVDDIRIFNYGMTQAQINTLFNEGSSVRYGQ